MGRTSSGVRNSGSNSSNGGLTKGDSAYKGKIKNIETLKNIKDKKLYNDIGQAISRYHSVMGVREKNIKLADLPEGVGGVQRTSRDGKSKDVCLSKAMFKNGTTKSVSKGIKEAYKTGQLTKTNKPVAHVVTHELAHASWNTNLSAPNARAASNDIHKVFKEWKNDTKKKGYGKYAEADVDEFWAETVTKAVHGKADKYTRAVKKIARKYEL